MTTLALDAAIGGFTIAIIEDGNILVSACESQTKMQSALLLHKIDELLTVAKKNLDDITAVLYGNGPGSFTSLRIGLATLMGLFFTPLPSKVDQGKRALVFSSCSSLLLRALSMSATQSEIACYLPAGRDRVYYGELKSGHFREEVLSLSEATGRKALPAQELVDPKVFLKILKTPVFYQTQPLAQVKLNYLLAPDIG